MVTYFRVYFGLLRGFLAIRGGSKRGKKVRNLPTPPHSKRCLYREKVYSFCELLFGIYWQIALFSYILLIKVALSGVMVTFLLLCTLGANPSWIVSCWGVPREQCPKAVAGIATFLVSAEIITDLFGFALSWLFISPS